jgi:hypothetical protein
MILLAVRERNDWCGAGMCDAGDRAGMGACLRAGMKLALSAVMRYG